MGGMYQGDLYCDACCEKLKASLIKKFWEEYRRQGCQAPEALRKYWDERDESGYESDQYPKYFSEQEEMDGPRCCVVCHSFFDNPIIAPDADSPARSGRYIQGPDDFMVGGVLPAQKVQEFCAVLEDAGLRGFGKDRGRVPLRTAEDIQGCLWSTKFPDVAFTLCKQLWLVPREDGDPIYRPVERWLEKNSMDYLLAYGGAYGEPVSQTQYDAEKKVTHEAYLDIDGNPLISSKVLFELGTMCENGATAFDIQNQLSDYMAKLPSQTLPAFIIR